MSPVWRVRPSADVDRGLSWLQCWQVTYSPRTRSGACCRASFDGPIRQRMASSGGLSLVSAAESSFQALLRFYRRGRFRHFDLAWRSWSEPPNSAIRRGFPSFASGQKSALSRASPLLGQPPAPARSLPLWSCAFFSRYLPCAIVSGAPPHWNDSRRLRRNPCGRSMGDAPIVEASGPGGT